MKDAEWIAQLGRCGLIAPFYIPSSEVMQLRLLTRRLWSYKQRQIQVKNEIHNLLQRANIKLTSYLADIFSNPGRTNCWTLKGHSFFILLQPNFPKRKQDESCHCLCS
ncbi:hypothetical protein [Streptococcus pluranimalium]|uniref:hypothetical protein n=1 Tax=Streptococcus pluranimalium TaxID=82348 RepID=UPI003F669B46